MVKEIQLVSVGIDNTTIFSRIQGAPGLTGIKTSVSQLYVQVCGMMSPCCVG